jgi:cytochrome c peroxidase
VSKRDINYQIRLKVFSGHSPLKIFYRKVESMNLLKSRTARIFCASMAVMLLVLSLPVVSSAQPLLDPNRVRTVAYSMGLGPLGQVKQVDPPELLNFVRTTSAVADPLTNPPTTAPPAGYTPRQLLTILGKALFWDQQVGSDGQACASCHFNAGADNRTKNQIDPGLRNTDPDEQNRFNNVGSGNAGGPNYDLADADFPFHKLLDTGKTDYQDRTVLFDTDDICSSQGSFLQQFVSVTPGQLNDNGTGVADPVFSVGGVNVRRVEPRNSPSTINATFQFWNFWDGEAHDTFNGVTDMGPLDANAFIYTNQGGLLQQTKVAITSSSLASQAVRPPLSDTEMSFAGRTWPDIGRKLLNLTPTTGAAPRPLGFQTVSRSDSLLGGPVDFNYPNADTGNGLAYNYVQLIQWVFQPIFWDSAGATAGTTVLTPTGFHLMENNLSTFFGLAIQAYEMTLVSDQTRFDKFMGGDNTALTQDEMKGLLTFVNTESAQINWDPIFNGIERGACQLCHSGPTLSENSKANVLAKLIVTIDVTAEIDNGRELAIVASTQAFDVGFSNVGARPYSDDMGRGSMVLGKPLSAIRQFLTGLTFPTLAILPLASPFPDNNRTSNIDGAVHIPGLRNIELTGPYFMNGGMVTLAQATQFYLRRGDFADQTINDLDIGLIMVDAVDSVDVLVKFLLALTDDRVRLESAPFDHPSLVIPNGHPGNNTVVTSFTAINGVNYATDSVINIGAVGATGFATQQPWIHSFLNVSNVQGSPGLDHFDR